MLPQPEEHEAAAAFRQTPPWSERTVRFRDWRATGLLGPGGADPALGSWSGACRPIVGEERRHYDLLRYTKAGNEAAVLNLLARGARVDCAGDVSGDYPPSPLQVKLMPFDLAVQSGHGALAARLLEHAGAGEARGATHPEVVPTAVVGPWGVFFHVNNAVCQVLCPDRPPEDASGHEFFALAHRRAEQWRGYLAVLRILVRSTMPLVTRHVTYRPRDPSSLNTPTHVELRDMRVPGAVPDLIPGNGLLALAVDAQDEDLAARLHLLGIRTVAGQSDMPASAVDTALLACRPEARRFVARSVVRTLLRRYFTLRLVAFYWVGQAARRRYATPDAAGFEEDMEAPVFREGRLGA